MARVQNRKNNQMRPISIEIDVNKYAHGSCLIAFGDTKVLCTASFDAKIPSFLKGKNKGWITAEYGMLPHSTHDRMDREAVKGKQTGRTQEIQRLIGRSLRSIVNLEALGENQIKIDCDVIQADGGTRTAAISGAYVALFLALAHMKNKNIIAEIPITSEMAAVSCGFYNSEVLLDLDYNEDSKATADCNFVLTGNGGIIEVQATAEEKPIAYDVLAKLYDSAFEGITQIITAQRKAILSKKF